MCCVCPHHILSPVLLCLEQLHVTEGCNPAKQLTEPCPSSSSLTVHSMLPFTVTWVIVWISDHRTTETQTSDFTLDLKVVALCGVWIVSEHLFVGFLP